SRSAKPRRSSGGRVLPVLASIIASIQESHPGSDLKCVWQKRRVSQCPLVGSSTAKKRRRIRGRLKRLIEAELRLSWSPEQISGRLSIERRCIDVVAAQTAALAPYGLLNETVTNDNGHEFQQPKALEAEPAVDVFFTEPSSLWQRGTVENTNGLLRQSFRKAHMPRKLSAMVSTRSPGCPSRCPSTTARERRCTFKRPMKFSSERN